MTPHPHKEGEGQGVGASGSAGPGHTLGPWRFDHDWARIPTVLGAGGQPVAYLPKSAIPERWSRTAEQEADATLIAAAPELLAALQDAHDKLHACTAVLSANDAAEVADTMAQARLVLAKARAKGSDQ